MKEIPTPVRQLRHELVAEIRVAFEIFGPYVPFSNTAQEIQASLRVAAVALRGEPGLTKAQQLDRLEDVRLIVQDLAVGSEDTLANVVAEAIETLQGKDVPKQQLPSQLAKIEGLREQAAELIEARDLEAHKAEKAQIAEANLAEGYGEDLILN